MPSLFPMFTSIGLFLLAYSCFSSTRKDKIKRNAKCNDWFMLTILMLCAYGVVDEILGRACIYNWWESLIVIGTFLFNYLTRKHRIWRYY